MSLRVALVFAILCASAVARAQAGPCGHPASIEVSAETRVEKDFVPIERVEWTGRFQEWSPWSFSLDWAKRRAVLRWRYMGQDKIDDHSLVLVDATQHEAVYLLDGNCQEIQPGKIQLGIVSFTLDGRDESNKLAGWRQRWGDKGVGVYLNSSEGVLDNIGATGAVSWVRMPSGEPIDVSVWRALRPRRTTNSSGNEIFRVQVRNVITETPEQRTRREEKERAQRAIQERAERERADSEAKERAQREAQERAQREAQERAQRAQREREARQQARLAATQREADARFTGAARAAFVVPPLPLVPCTPAQQRANPVRCARIDKAKQRAKEGAKDGEGGVRLRDASVDDQATCPENMKQVTFSCRITPPADHGGCQTHSTQGSDDECLGSVSCCLPPRSTRRVLDRSQSCKIRECEFVTAGLSAAQEEALCPAREAGAQCRIAPEVWPSLAGCTPSPAPVGSIAAAPAGMWSAASCRAFGESLDAAEAAAGQEHLADHEARLAAEAAGDKIPCPHVCKHPTEFMTKARALDGLHHGITIEITRQKARRSACWSPLGQALIDAAGIAGDLRGRIVERILGYRPPKDDTYGPYTEWSSPAMGFHAHSEPQLRSLCDSLAQFEACVAARTPTRP